MAHHSTPPRYLHPPPHPPPYQYHPNHHPPPPLPQHDHSDPFGLSDPSSLMWNTAPPAMPEPLSQPQPQPQPRSHLPPHMRQYHPSPIHPPANVRRRYSVEPMSDHTKSARRATTGNSGPTAHSSGFDMPSEMHSPKKGAKRPPGQPLRRGDACLMCRAKKLKCSATKPICDQCHKRKDRCVYDAVRPASRVEKLERKLAEMEEAEFRAALAARRHSAEATLTGPAPSTSSSHPNLARISEPAVNLQSPMPFDLGLYQFQAPTQGTPFDPASSGLPAAMSQPGNLNSWQWTQPNPFDTLSTGLPSSGLPSASTSAVQLDQLPWPLLGASNDLSTLWNGPEVEQQIPPSRAGSDGFAIDALQNLGLESLNMDPIQKVMHQTIQDPHLSDPFGAAMAFGPTAMPPEAAAAIDGVLSHVSSISEAAQPLTEKDISQSAQDYLLDLFFCEPRRIYGSEAFSETQFRAKMSLPPHERPHPCLLFGMYTVASSGSYIPGVRALSDSLYSIAIAKLDEAIAQEDRILDAVRSSKLIGKWLFSKARPLEAYTMTWKSVSLVMACQLDRIPTSVWTPAMLGKGERDMDNPWPILGPPKDQLELMERIHAFWATWGNARGAAIMMPWETPIRDDLIITPLPRDPSAYLDGTILREPDMTLRDIYELPHVPKTKLKYHAAILMSAVHLLHRAKTLRSELPEARPTFRELGRHSRAPKHTFCARQDHPAAYQELMDSSQYLLNNMPTEHQIRWLDPIAPWDNDDVPTVYAALFSVRMMLHEPEGDEYDRTTCLDAAREMCSVIKLMLKSFKEDANAVAAAANPNGTNTANDKFNGTMRWKHGLGGPYSLTAWYWTADRLIRGAKVLRGLGRMDEAQGCAEDAAGIVDSLRSLGILYPIASEQADIIEKSQGPQMF